ncbi:MAG: hypothetical protein Q9220_003362 [cf. Caloplaca sp. 1 TL-2023]
MDLPNELILNILSCLPIRDLKQTRLVSKLLASLGGQLLVDTLYLTPREKDMEVFDQITQHPDLKKSIKKIHYDSAQFRKLSLVEYCHKLCEQLKVKGTGHRDVPLGVEGERLREIIEEIYKTENHSWRVEMCEQQVPLVKGHRLYSQYALEQGNILSEGWSARVCKGLRSLSPLESVTIKSTWNLDCETLCDDGTLTEEELYNFEDERCHMTVAERAFDRAIDKQTCQRRLMGPPTARAYHPVYLVPEFAKFDESSSTRKRLLHEGASNGCLEFVKILQILRLARKEPVELIAHGDSWGRVSGIPPYLFNPSIWPCTSTLFSYLAPRMHRLDLRLSSYDGGRVAELFADVSGLRTFLSKARALQHLNLEMPHNGYIGSRSPGIPSQRPLYTFQQVFPSISTLRFDDMTYLNIVGLGSSFKNIVGLLLLAVPNLDDLILRHIDLTTSGAWEEVIEGLRHYSPMSSGYLDGPLNDMNGVMYGYEIHGQSHVDFYVGTIDYIGLGGRHPALPADAPDSASLRYLVRLNKVLEELRIARRFAGLVEEDRELLGVTSNRDTGAPVLEIA